MEILIKTKKLRLKSDFSLGHHCGWRGHIKQNEFDWRFQSYKGNNLCYGMLCESVNSDQEEKQGDLLNGDRVINLNNLITNVDKLQCANNVHMRGIYR